MPELTNIFANRTISIWRIQVLVATLRTFLRLSPFKAYMLIRQNTDTHGYLYPCSVLWPRSWLWTLSSYNTKNFSECDGKWKQIFKRCCLQLKRMVWCRISQQLPQTQWMFSFTGLWFPSETKSTGFHTKQLSLSCDIYVAFITYFTSIFTTLLPWHGVYGNVPVQKSPTIPYSWSFRNLC